MTHWRSAALLLVLVACTEAPAPVEKKAPPPAAPVQTDRSRYVLREGPFAPEATIRTTFTAGRRVYLANCNGAFTIGLQKRVGSEWTHAWASEINACFSPPIVIEAGESLDGLMTVDSGADAFVTSRKTEQRIDAGTYRAVWHGLFTSPDLKEMLPIEQRISAPIRIAVAPFPDPWQPSPKRRPSEIAFLEPEHDARVGARVTIRVRFSTPPHGEPHLYLDTEPVEYVRRSGTEIEYTPRRLAEGRHAVRVLYADNSRKLRWYAWSFTVRLAELP